MRLAPLALALCTFGLPAVAPTLHAQTVAPHGKGLTIKLKTSAGQDAGTATFREKDSVLVVELHLINLPPGDHGVHIHEKPLCEAPDFKSAGGHFNPDNKQHGYMNPAGHHNGDLPQNVTIGPDGTGSMTFETAALTLKTGSPHNILNNGGTSIMVHAGADDEKTDPSGNSGARIACCVIKPLGAAQ